MKRTISIILTLLLLISCLPVGTVLAAEPESYMANGDFETGNSAGTLPAEWTTVYASGTVRQAIWATDIVHGGSHSVKLVDTTTNSAFGLRGTTAQAVVAGEEYYMEGWYYAESGSADFMMEFRTNKNTQGNVPKLATSTLGKWTQISVAGAARSDIVAVRPYLNITYSGTGSIYFDDIFIKKLTPELLVDHIDICLDTNNATHLYNALVLNTAKNAGITGVVNADANKNQYLTDAIAARTAKGSALTLAEIAAIVTKANDKVAVAAAKTALSGAAELELYATGAVALPAVNNEGITAVWTAVSGTAAGRFTVADGTATLNSLPTAANETATLTLTLTKGTASDTVDYSVLVHKEVTQDDIDDLCDIIRQNDADATLQALKNQVYNFENVIDANKEYYQTGLLAALTEAASLSQSDIQNLINSLNTDASDAAAIETQKTTLEGNNTLVLDAEGTVAVPAVSEGIQAVWTSVAAPGDQYVIISGKNANVDTLGDTEQTFQMTLTITKGKASASIVYNVTLKKQPLKKLEISNPSFEYNDAEGYPTDWTISNVLSKNEETGAIVTEAKVSKDCAYKGAQSALLQDYSGSLAVGLRSSRAPASPNYEYQAQAYVRGSGTAVIYLEFYSANGTRISTKTVTKAVTNDWSTINVTATAPAETVGVAVLLYSNQGHKTNDVYYDDVRLYEVPADVIAARVNAALAADDSTALMAALRNGALGLTITPGHDAEYVQAMKTAANGSTLTTEQIRTAAAAATAQIDAADKKLLEDTAAALTGSGAQITVNTLGFVAVPTAATENGISASWTAADESGADYLVLRNGTIDVRVLPMQAAGDKPVGAVLTLVKGSQTLDVDYTLLLKAYSQETSELAAAAQTLTEEMILGENPSTALVTKKLTLPNSLDTDIQVTWAADDTAVVDPSTGAVTRPAYGTTVKSVTLTATLTKGTSTFTKTFLLTVLGAGYDEGRVMDVLNGDFEQGSLNGWLPAYRDGTFQVSKEIVYGGTYALKITDPSSGTSAAVKSNVLRTVKEGYTYQLNVLAYADQSTATPSIYLEFWNNDGLRLLAKNVSYAAANRGKWQTLTVTGTAPVGATGVSVLLYSGNGSVGDCYFDNVKVSELPLLKNQSAQFENIGWTLNGGAAVSSGTMTLPAGSSAVSEAISAVKQVRYYLAADAVNVSGGTMALQFYNGTTLVKEELLTVSGSGTQVVSSLVPTDAKTVKFSFGGEMAVSDIEIYAAPVGLQVANGSFDEGLEGYTVTGTAAADSGTAVLAAGSTLTSGNIPVFGGMTYEAAAEGTTDNAELVLRFYNMIGVKVAEERTAMSSTGLSRVSAVAPYNSYTATVSVEAAAAAQIDALQLRTLTSSVSNASFENLNVVIGGTFPYQWTPVGSVVVLPTTAECTLGTQGLELRGLNAAAAGGVHSSSIVSAKAGESYRAAIQAKAESGSAALYLRYYDENHKQLAKAKTTISGSSWQRYEVEAAAPTGTACAVIAVEVQGEAVVYLDEAAFVPGAIDVGSNVQLFLDDYLIESMENTTRTFHKAEKTDPIVTREHPWETNVYLYGTVLYDEEEGIYKMWYQCGNFVCYATSEDGVEWEKPLDLGIYEFEGSTDNNILGVYHIANVFKDPKEADASKRYKMVSFNFDYNTTYSYYCLYTSPDGIHWSEPTEVIYSYDVINIVYDEINEQYVGIAKIYEYEDSNYRTKRYARAVVSKDLIHWSEPIKMNSLGDLTDAEGYLRADSYGCGLYATGDSYVGFNWVYSITNIDSTDGYIDVELVLSRDLSEDFQRVSYDPIIERGPDGSWDDEMIYTAASPIIMGDELWMYYGGWDGDHLCDARYAEIGIAKWRLNGFASLDSGSNGVITTKPLTFSGNQLLLNAVAGSGIQVEILDENGNVIPGFSKDNSTVMMGDNVAYEMTWFGADLGTLEGRTVQLRIYSNGGQLYSIQFADAGSTGSGTGGSHRPQTPVKPSTPSKPTQTELPFTDVKKTDWFYNDVVHAYSNGLMSGTGAKTFDPGLATSRGMIVTILWRLEGEPAAKSSSFADVTNGSWYAEAVAWAAENGIVTGYSDTQFGPMDQITREQLAAILFRYAQYKGYDTTARDDLKSFPDADKVSDWAKEAVQWAVAEGLINGMDGRLNPQGTATRAQVAAILKRFMENIA